MNELRTWETGPEIPAWPYLKYHRAVEHAQYLAARVHQFNARAVYRAPIRLSDDRYTFLLMKPHGIPAPVDEWVLPFADAVHNLRVALDSLVWELSHAKGASPVNPRDVFFPVLTDESKWPKAARALSTVPEEQLRRIRDVQPFLAEDTQLNTLSLLAKFDNSEKHRRTLVSRFLLQSVAIGGSGFSFDDSECVEEREEVGFLADPVDDPEPGEPIAEFRWHRPLKEGSTVPPHALLDITPSAVVGDVEIDAIPFLQEAVKVVHQILEYVTKGEGSGDG